MDLININVEEIIFTSFAETPHRKFESYNSYLLWSQKCKKFCSKLSEDLKREFNELDDAYSNYEVERLEECCKFSINCYKKLIGLK